MKKSSNNKRKLSKNELKEISGGANRPICPRVVSCIDPNTGEDRYGVPGMQDGFCC